MSRQNILSAIRQANGVIRYIDTINREMRVQVADTTLTLDIPLDCAIFLHGERVKLRMLQSLDRVRITYVEHRNYLAARTIEVQPN